MKKLLKSISMLLMVAMLTVFGLTACGGGGGGGGGAGGTTEVDEKTVTIKCVKAGFGTDWLYELKEKFESAFAEEGYKLNILNPSRDFSGNTIVQELYQGYDTAMVDLYITGDVTADMVSEYGEYGLVVSDLEELVYNQPVLNYNGESEGVTVREKTSSDILPYVTDSTGRMSGFNWVQSSAGLVVNARKLAEYGITELPRTTDEMFACFDAIYLGANGVGNSYESGTYPITYVPGTANGYALCWLNTMLAQYDRAFYDTFWSFEDANGAKLSDADAQNLFKHDAVLEMLDAAYRAFDVEIAAPGSTQQGLDQAQAKIMSKTGGAVFMFNGDWMLNEVKLNYSNYVNDIDFVNFPVVSAVGTKLFGAGTSYGLSDAECDKLLSYIVKLVDENKSIEEIVADVKANKGVDLATADAEAVAATRGISYSRGVEHLAFIAKDTPKKDIAALVLRMMASEDFGRTFAAKANGATPYYAEEITQSYSFVENASKIPANRYYTLISSGAKGYRKQLGVLRMFSTQLHIPDYIVSKSTSTMFEGGSYMDGATPAVYTNAAKTLQNEEYNNIVKNWDNYKKNAGIN